MPEFLENPRRTPRVPIRCRAQVSLPWGSVEAVTEDVSARGCQLILPRPPELEATIGLVLCAPGHAPTLRADGRVAWVSARAPWRVGVAFAAEALPGAAAWVESLRRASPGIFPQPRAPERVAVEATVYLGPVPRLVDFDGGELAILRAVGAGQRVGELRTRLAGGWAHGERAFFALLFQGHLTLSRAGAVHPLGWKAILGEPACAAPGRPAVTPRPAALLRALTPVPARPAPPTPSPAPTPTRAASPTPPPAAERPRRPGPNDARAGSGWRAPAGPRPPSADEILHQARARLSSGNAHQALALLRLALSMAPGDPEIAVAIGVAMQMGRTPP